MLRVLRIVGPDGTLGHADIFTGIQVPDRFEWVDSILLLLIYKVVYHLLILISVYVYIHQISIGTSACALPLCLCTAHKLKWLEPKT